MLSTGTGRRILLCSDATMAQYLYVAREEDIIPLCQKGIYAVNFGGGEVDITSGKFVFSANEAYLIEDGKITVPVKALRLLAVVLLY